MQLINELKFEETASKLETKLETTLIIDYSNFYWRSWATKRAQLFKQNSILHQKFNLSKSLRLWDGIINYAVLSSAPQKASDLQVEFNPTREIRFLKGSRTPKYWTLGPLLSPLQMVPSCSAPKRSTFRFRARFNGV